MTRLAALPVGAARHGAAAVRAAGGDAFAPTLGDLERLGPTLKIRDLRLEAVRAAPHEDLR